MIVVWYLAVALTGGAIGLAIAGQDGAAFWMILGAAAMIAIALSGGARR